MKNSQRINELEILITILEAKLNSVPELASMPSFSSSVVPPEPVPTSATLLSSHPAGPPHNTPPAPPQPRTILNTINPSNANTPNENLVTNNHSGSELSVSLTVIPANDVTTPADSTISTTNENLIAVKDHPMYAPFIKLLRIGVPVALVKSKVASVGGLDPELVDTPDAKIPRQ